MNPNDRLVEIRRRWKATKVVEVWRSLPERDREAVLAEIDEAAREASSTTLTKGLTAALDVLDVTATDGSLGIWTQAMNDITWLLDQLDMAGGADGASPRRR